MPSIIDRRFNTKAPSSANILWAAVATVAGLGVLRLPRKVLIGAIVMAAVGAATFKWWQGREPEPLGKPPGPRAKSIRIDGERLHVEADDGRQRDIPLHEFPRLANATVEQRNHWELLGRGISIHWPDIDEDISVPRLFGSLVD